MPLTQTVTRIADRDQWRQWGSALWNHFVRDGYIWDWLLALALIIVNFTVPGPVIKPAERYYSRKDPALSYPSVHVPLSETQKFWVEFAVPGVVALVVQFCRRRVALGAKLFDWHHLMLSTLESFAVESSFKKWMNLVGRLRPDWLARLATQDPETILEGRTSYPSGHAAEMFAVFTVLTLYLCAKTHLFVAAGPGHFAKAVLCLLPLGLATFISMSRLVGYKHDFSDINAGMMIGLGSGAFAYHLNYPSPFGPGCAEPRARATPGKAAPVSEEEGGIGTPLLEA